MLNFKCPQVQSQANVIQNLMLYKYNQSQPGSEEVKLEDFPNLSDIA